MTHNDRSNVMPQALLIAARFCLIVSLWQAPVPWLHCHGSNLSQLTSVASAMELSSHLAIFHPMLESNDDHELGWHWHWILPSWSHAIDETPNDVPPAFELVAFDPVTVSPFVSMTGRDRIVDTISTSLSHWRLMRQLPIFGHPHNSNAPVLAQKAFAVLRC